MTKRNYCSECGRKLLKDTDRGRSVRFCPVHIYDMNPVTAKNKVVKEFKKLKGHGD